MASDTEQPSPNTPPNPAKPGAAKTSPHADAKSVAPEATAPKTGGKSAAMAAAEAALASLQERMGMAGPADEAADAPKADIPKHHEIGRASCRERV